MAKSNLVSIIIPVYKVEDYIERCLLSVLNQTYNKLEVLLIDDCGNDRSIDIATNVIDKNNKAGFKIQWLRHDQNCGQAAARNTGLRAASGDYVFFLDSDDEISHNCIELMMNCVEEHPDTEVVIGNIKALSDDYETVYEHDIRNKHYPSRFTDNHSIRMKYYDVSSSLPINPVNKLLKRTFLISNNLFFKEGIIHEDVHWCYFLIKHVTNMSFVEDFTYFYATNPCSTTHSSSKKRSAMNYAIIYGDWISALDADYFEVQYNFCIHMIIPWYEEFHNLKEYKELYARLFKIAFTNNSMSAKVSIIKLGLRGILFSFPLSRSIINKRRNTRKRME